MKRNHICIALLTVLAGIQTVPAITAENPYVGPITNRNIFSLKPPPRPEDLNPVAPPPPLPVVQLSGITTLLGKKVAVMRLPRPARPSEPAKEVSVMLGEGAPAEEGIQVLEINVAAGTVKIMNGGTQQTLDITKNAPKSAPAPAAPGGLPVPAAAGGIPIPAPRTTPAVAPPVTSTERPVRSSDPSNPNQVVGGGPFAMSATTSANSAPPITLEEQMILMEVNKVQNPDHPPTPPTELTELLEQENGGGGPPAPSGPPSF